MVNLYVSDAPNMPGVYTAVDTGACVPPNSDQGPKGNTAEHIKQTGRRREKSQSQMPFNTKVLQLHYCISAHNWVKSEPCAFKLCSFLNVIEVNVYVYAFALLRKKYFTKISFYIKPGLNWTYIRSKLQIKT